MIGRRRCNALATSDPGIRRNKRARTARSPAVVAAVKGGKQALKSMTSIVRMESCSGMKPE